MSEERLKKVKIAAQQVAKSVQNLALQQVLLLEERKASGEPLEPVRKRKNQAAAGSEAAADVPPPPSASNSKGKAKATKKRDREAEAEPAAADAAEWQCDGNVIAGTPHPKGVESVRAPNTKHDGKTYVSCKNCKRDIKKSKAVQKAE